MMSAQFALLLRPSTTSLGIALILAIGGWALHTYLEWSTRADPIVPLGSHHPGIDDAGQTETPAQLSVLLHPTGVPRSAVTGTVLDLSARGWLQLTAAEGELVVVTHVTPPAGDQLTDYEQQVLNHISARAFNGLTSAGTLAAARSDLGRRWWWRFNRSVTTSTQDHGLTIDRYPLALVATTAVAAVLSVVLTLWSLGRGTATPIDESWISRVVWLVVLVAGCGLVVSVTDRLLSHAQIPTEAGHSRAGRWLGYRSRLAAQIPANASVIGNPSQQRALAASTVMGVTRQVMRQVPIIRSGSRYGWSESTGTPHVVAVSYPVRPGYGQHPLKVAAAGLAGLVLIGWLRGFLQGVGDGSRFGSLTSDLPGQASVLGTVTDVASFILLAPLGVAAWAALAGLVDSMISVERVGLVVRARSPEEVVHPTLARFLQPVGRRGGYMSYLAVDDGSSNRLVAWLASERSAAPEGAQARVRATPLLGYVHESDPIGTGGRADQSMMTV